MTVISRDDIQHLATLSALSLTDEEVEPLRNDIARIVGYIDQLAELNTDGVEPTYQVTGLQNVWREDTLIPSSEAETLVSLAHSSQENSIKVPKVL